MAANIDVIKTYIVDRGSIILEGDGYMFQAIAVYGSDRRDITFLHYNPGANTWRRLDTGAVINSPPAVLVTLGTAFQNLLTAFDSVIAAPAVQAFLASKI